MRSTPSNNTFFQVLTQAINDLANTGYDNPERLNEWLRRLRIAAMAWLPSEDESRNQMQQALWKSLQRATSRTSIMRYHPGTDRFTLDRLAPQFRSLLDARIMASADLIKLNRDQAIEKTLQRFSGWATSIPIGGSAIVNKREIKAHIAKPTQHSRWEQRRLEIDQGHKLMSNISATIADATGALAMRWRSNWRQPGYNYRKDHKERDNVIYTIRGNWAISQGLMKKGPDGYLDEITQPAEEPFCRCFGVYITALREIPEDMLTAKGKQALQESSFRRA